MKNSHYVSLSINGQNQVLTIPQEFALSSTKVLLRKDGDRLIIEPLAGSSLLSLLTTLSDIPDHLPESDEGLLPLDDITL